jgi:hypothetical protein
MSATRSQIIVMFLLLCCIAEAVAGQDNKPPADQNYVVVPNDMVLLVIAAQPGAPIRFDDARLLMSVDGSKGLAFSYDLYNSGTKAIRYFTPVMWTSFDTGGTLGGPLSGARISPEWLIPGQTIKSGTESKIVPLTTDLREKLKLRVGGEKLMVVLMVQNITFVDGTTYSDDSTLKAMQSYFEDLSNKMERLESLERKPR